jgi:hypothetical protein
MDAQADLPLFQCKEKPQRSAGNTDALPSVHPKNENYHHFLLNYHHFLLAE